MNLRNLDEYFQANNMHRNMNEYTRTPVTSLNMEHYIALLETQ